MPDLVTRICLALVIILYAVVVYAVVHVIVAGAR